jgi:hypothetical protein
VRLAAVFAGGAAALAIWACAGVDDEARIDGAVAPSGTAFRPVAQVLVDRCGSLDCHGSKYRNMRLFGFGSARIDPAHRPDAPETTDDEVLRSYQAVVALEPEVLRTVIAEGGVHPERLTFVRKGRGTEAHVGGAPIGRGDPADLCIISWLGGATDEGRCRAAVPRLGDP